jgi:hypothetical protein
VLNTINDKEKQKVKAVIKPLINGFMIFFRVCSSPTFTRKNAIEKMDRRKIAGKIKDLGVFKKQSLKKVGGSRKAIFWHDTHIF